MAEGHGGFRPGAGRKPIPGKPKKIRAENKVKPRALDPAEPKKDFVFQDVMHLLPELEEMSRKYSRQQRRTEDNNPFRLPTHPPQIEAAIKRAGLNTMAMDGALQDNLNFSGAGWLASGEFDALPGQGLVFLGFTYLAELAQRPEFRVMSETIADDATRKWIDFDVVGDENKQREEREKDPAGYDERMADPDQRKKRVSDAGKLDKVKALKDDQLRLMVKDRFYEMSRGDGFFGRMHLFLDIRVNDSNEIDNNDLKSPLGDSWNPTISPSKVPLNSFKGLRSIEPVWTYPLMYNAINPLREDWYNPQVWFVMGQEIHGSRLQTFIGHPVPDMLKPAYSFSGLSLTQMAKPYVDIWLKTRASVAELIHSFSVMVLMTDLGTTMQPGNLGAVLGRVAMFNMLRDNQGTFVVNKNHEDFKNVSASLSGLHELQAQSQEHMAAVHRIPLVKFTGIQPSGLNASSEGEIETYDDTIMAYQSRVLDPNLRKIINFQQWSLFGELDPEITHRWEKLRDMTLAEKGQKEKDDADRNQKYVDMGAISPGEVRKAIIEDPELPYTGLDPEDVPEPPAEEGLLGPGAGGAAKVDAEAEKGIPDKGGGADDAALPFGATDEWTEGDHPRAPDGKFGSGGGGSGKALDPAKLKKQGGKLGSNEGGTFTDESGQKFYIKRPASKAHVENELAAARLYQLAGVQTLDYRPVQGGNHVATAWQDLDKKNIRDFTPAERKEAAKDFAVHAWLSNWDAAGLGGDNQGIIGGKPATLDVGGSLRYRAQGTPKGSHFGNAVTEIDTLRDPKMNPDAAGLFGKMTDSEIKASVAGVTKIPDDAIRAAVGDDKALAEQLIARKQNMAQRFGLAQDEAGKFEEGKHPRDPDGKFTSGGGSGGGAGGGSVFKSKKEHAAHLLEKGTTTAEMLAALKWPSISMPQMAKTLGMKLEKIKEGGVTKYKGTPMTDAEKSAEKGKAAMAAAAKVEAAKLEAAKKPKVEEGFSGTTVAEFSDALKKAMENKDVAYVQNLVKYNPQLAKEYYESIEAKPAPKATPEELKKAKKSTPVPISSSDPDVVGIIKDFNEKYAGKDNLTPEQLNQKVQDFKDAQVKITLTNQANSAKQAEAQKVAQAATAEKLKKIAAENKAKTAGYMKDLGITEAEAIGFEALVDMHGGNAGDLVQKFQHYEKQAKDIGYPISGFEYALLRDYINGGYKAVNAGLRDKTVSLKNHVYAKMVNGALDKLPKYTGEVQRGTTLSPEQIAEYKPGHVVRHGSFTSTGAGFKFSGNVHYKIKAVGKRGADIRGANGHEKEILFKSNTFFLVHKVEQKGGTTHIEMEEVDHG